MNRTSTASARNGNNGRVMEGVPPPLPAANASRPPRQMATLAANAEIGTAHRGWDNGVGGYQTNTMLETRIGNNALEGN